MSNPRKFSEKIALHTQKQAEETAAFRKIMEEVTGATKAGKDDPTISSTKQVKGNHNTFEFQPFPNSRNLLTAPHTPQRAGSMPNVHQNSQPDRGGACALNVRNAICNLALMRQGRDSNRQFNSSTHLTASNAPIRPSSACSSRGPSPIPSAAIRDVNRSSSIVNDSKSTAQHNFTHNGSIGRSSLLQSARAECQPYLLRPPNLDSQWRRTNSDSALHQSSLAAEQNQAFASHNQQFNQYHPHHQHQSNLNHPNAQLFNRLPTNQMNALAPNAISLHSQNNTNAFPQSPMSPTSPTAQSETPMYTMTSSNPSYSTPTFNPSLSNSTNSQLNQLTGGNGQMPTSPLSASPSPSHTHSPSVHAFSNSIPIPGGNNLCSPNHSSCHQLSQSLHNQNHNNFYLNANSLINNNNNNNNNSYLMSNNLSSRFGGSHGVGLETLGTVPNNNLISSSSATNLNSIDPNQATSSSSSNYVNHERPRSCDLPNGLNGLSNNCSLPNSALNSQLSSPLSMQLSPIHSPPSYASGMQSPQSNMPMPTSPNTTSNGQTFVNHTESNLMYQNSIASPQISSPPAYPAGSNTDPSSVASTNDPSRPESTSLSSAGSPPQLIPQSPQSQTQPLSPAPSQAQTFPLDLDGLEDCFNDMQSSASVPLYSNSISNQSPPHIQQINSNETELLQNVNSPSSHSAYQVNSDCNYDTDSNGSQLSMSQNGNSNHHLQHQTKMLEQQLQQFKMADSNQSRHLVLLSNQDQSGFCDQNSINQMNSTNVTQATSPQTPTTIPDIILTAPSSDIDGLRDCANDMLPNGELLNFDDLQFYSEFCRDQGFSLDNS